MFFYLVDLRTISLLSGLGVEPSMIGTLDCISSLQLSFSLNHFFQCMKFKEVSEGNGDNMSTSKNQERYAECQDMPSFDTPGIGIQPHRNGLQPAMQGNDMKTSRSS